MEGVWAWLSGVDGAWVGLAGVVIGALLAGRYSRRSARIAALATLDAADAQRNGAERTAQISAKVQLVVARESFRFKQLDAAYTNLIAHLEEWDRWAHAVNTYNYALHSEDDPDLPFNLMRPHPDDPRNATSLSFPEIEDITKPFDGPLSVHPSPETSALLAAYASKEARELYSQWESAAHKVAYRSFAILESGRAIEWKEDHPRIIRKTRAEYPEMVDSLDKTKQKLVQRLGDELQEQIRVESLPD